MRIKNKQLTTSDVEGYKKMVLRMSCGVGTEVAEAFLVPITTSEDILNSYAWECAVEHAQGYGVYTTDEAPEDWDEDSEDNSGWDRVEYNSDNIEGWFEPYDSTKHDGILTYSNDFEWKEL